MATCKDCLHVEACEFISQRQEKFMNDFFNEQGREISVKFGLPDAEKCPYFKDRSRFVELPCVAGDTVYYIVNVNGEDTISSAVVDKVAIYKSGTIGYDCGVGEIGFSSKSIGKRVFLTQAEAEQTLAK